MTEEEQKPINAGTTNFCPNCEAMAKENERLKKALKWCALDYELDRYSDESEEEQLKSYLDQSIQVARKALGEE